MDRRRLCLGVLRRNAHADDTHCDAQTRVSQRLAGLNWLEHDPAHGNFDRSPSSLS